jgi:hypothetical protein
MNVPDPESLRVRWWIAFSLLILAIHEAHELAHVLTGRVLCGTWAARDFNAWWFTAECSSVLPTVAGPVFSYLVMIAGALAALRVRPSLRWAGVALLFAANPFARIFTAAMGGGDEMVVGKRIAATAARTPAVPLLVLLFVAAVCGTSLILGWRAMRGLRRRTLWFVVLTIWPMIVTGTLLFAIGNRLLRAGVLAEPKLAGAPPLVLVVTAVVVVLACLTFRWLSRQPPILR